MENYQIRKIDNHTWQLEDPFRTYLYLLEGEKEALLIDAGNGFSGLKEVVASLTDKPVTVALTHGHFDHTGAAAEFEKCLIHKADVQVLSQGFDRESRKYQVKRFSEIFDLTLPDEEITYLVNAKEPENLEYLTEGQKIDLGNRVLEVIETPGHTHGCVCFLDVKNGCLFAGDTGCNREILVYFDHSATVEDVKLSDEKLLARKAEYTQIWPGHHECPMDASCLEDYRKAAEDILENPGIGEKIPLDKGYKILYNYHTIGISYTEAHIHRFQDFPEYPLRPCGNPPDRRRP